MLFHVVLFAALAQSAPPQSAPPAAPPRVQPGAPADADAATLANGWTAVAAGRVDAAVRGADAILRERPWDRAALQLKIAALSKAQALRGLGEYERWIQTGHVDEAGLLEPVAIAVLQEIARGPKPELKTPALRALAAAHVRGAPEALAAAGDSDAGHPDVAALLERTKSDNPQVRAAAVEALGGVKTDAARAAVAPLRQDPDPAVRTAATIALARMGDQASLTAVEQMLSSGVPDVQIMAARVYEGRPGPWVAAIRPLLDNPDGLTRLEAAQAIAPVDPDAARRVLTTALADDNPVIRYESAKTLAGAETLPLSVADLATLRQRLRDPDAAVRMAVAGALLRLARQ